MIRTCIYAAALATIPMAALAEMTLTSPTLVEGGILPADQVMNGFGCTGANLSPALAWDGAPDGTKSFILTAYDPDAPTGSGWWHWTVVNIPVMITSLPEGASSAGLPDEAVQGRTDFGSAGFGGACPPEGNPPHHYIFSVYAMPEATLLLDENASGALVGFYANGMALDHASLTVIYGRN